MENKNNHNIGASEEKSYNLDVPDFPDTIPKEINKVLNTPPVIPSVSYPINYGLPTAFQAQHPYQNNNFTTSFPHHLYQNPNNQIYNSIWTNQYMRRNIINNHASEIPSVVSKLAEDKLRPTFKSIEMILETFNSINMILESTYSTIYGTFRTMTNVADHFLFVQNHLAELALLPRLTHFLIDFLRWLFKLFGLNNTTLGKMFENHNQEGVWLEALSQSSSESFKNELLNERNSKSSLWPVMVFFSLVFGTPYIVWQLLGATRNHLPRSNNPEWTFKNGKHFIAIGLSNFQARNSSELSFRKGQTLFIKPESLQPGSRWLLACTVQNNENDDSNQPIQIGLIPLNLVKLIMNNR